MGRGTTVVTLGLVVVLAGIDARARADAREIERLSLEELMGVRVRSATLASQTIETVPSVMSVITEEQIRLYGLRTLADALQLMPGVTVLPTQFNGLRVVVRGKAGANDVLVTLDGERLNDFYDGSYLVEFPLENIERIELIRGPGSALYGTNAFAGVISMYSKQRMELFGGAGAESYFDHSAGWGVRGYAKVAHRWRRFSAEAFGSYWETSGPKVLVERDNADPSWSRVPGETAGMQRIAIAQLVLKRESNLVRGDLLEVWGLYQYRRRGPSFGPNNIFAPDSTMERSSVHLALTYSLPLPAGVRLHHRFSFDRRAANNLIQDRPPGFFHEVDGNFEREPGELFPDGVFRSFDWVTFRLLETSQLDWVLPHPRGIIGNELIIGGRLEYAWLPEFDFGQNFCCGEAFRWAGPTLRNWEHVPLTQIGKDRLIAAAFVHDQMEVIRGLWITVGLRLDYYNDFGPAWSPRAAVVYRPHPKVSFKLLYGRAFRAPTFRDLYDETGVSETAGGVRIMGNPELRPETTNTAELGVETTPWRMVTLRASGFYVRSSDVIEVDATFTTGGTVLTNFPGLQIWGAEAEGQLHYDEHNYLAANVSLFDAQQLGVGLPGYQRDPERRFIDTRLYDLPRLRLNVMAVAAPFARLRWPAPLRKLSVGLTYRYVAAVANNDRFTFEALDVFRQPQYSELSANVIVPVWRDRVEIITTVEAALGRTIAIPLAAGWYDLPTNVANLFVGLRIHDGDGRRTP